MSPGAALPAELRSERVRLRRWRDSDRAPFARLNADPRVMEHFPAPLSREQSDQLAERIRASLEERGWGLWALEVPATGGFCGFVGLNPLGADFGTPFAPAVEVGWRLAVPAWGHGYATEAARLALDLAFRELALEQVVSFTTVGNQRSRRVMERLGMRRDPGDDFEHPGIPPGHPLRAHVLYRLGRADWPAAATAVSAARRGSAGPPGPPPPGPGRGTPAAPT